MTDGFLIAVLAGLGGMFGWGLADFFAKKTIDEIGDVVSLVWGHVFGTIALFIIALYQVFGRGQSFDIPTELNVWLLLIFFGLLQAAVYLFVYKGFGKGQVVVLNPIFASFSGLVALFSIIFLGEPSTGDTLISLGGIFVGVFLLSTDVNQLFKGGSGIIHAPGAKEVFIATIFATIWTILWDRFIGGQDWVSFAFFMYLFMTIGLIIYAKIKKMKLSFHQGHMWKYLVLIGVCEIIAYLAISLGYSATTRTSIVAMLSGAFSLPTIVLAYIFLKERMTKAQALGCVLVVAGIVILSLV